MSETHWAPACPSASKHALPQDLGTCCSLHQACSPPHYSQDSSLISVLFPRKGSPLGRPSLTPV